MLYIKKIDEITYEEIQTFCNQNIKENEILEYKADFTRNLEKVISSMANTYGGLIIIGINDDDGYPRLPFEGIDYVTGLQEKVTQIDISNIFPPVLPEIQVCPPINNKTFVVIRIAESDSTPHYIKNKTRAYVRTGNISTPERIADVNELEWLRNRRQKTTEFRELLLSNAEYHYTNIGKLEGLSSVPYSETTISMCPLFPSKSILLAPNIEEMLYRMNRRQRITYSEMKHYRHLPIQYGLATYLIQGDIFDYLEINQFGLVVKKRNLEWEEQRPTEEQIEDNETVERKKISFEDIFLSISAFFEFINLFYEIIGYHGYCKLNLSIKNTLNISLNPYVGGTRILSEGESIVEEYLLPEKFQTISIPKFRNQNERLNTLIEVSKDIAWTFGSEIDPFEGDVDDFLRRHAMSRIRA